MLKYLIDNKNKIIEILEIAADNEKIPSVQFKMGHVFN